MLPLHTQSLGADQRCAVRAGKDARGLLTAHQAKGAGYAISRPEELQTVIEVAESTGAFSTAVPSAQPHSSVLTIAYASVWGIRHISHLTGDNKQACL